MSKSKTKIEYYTETFDDQVGDFIWENKWWLRLSYIPMFLIIPFSIWIFVSYFAILEFGIIRNYREVCF